MTTSPQIDPDILRILTLAGIPQDAMTDAHIALADRFLLVYGSPESAASKLREHVKGKIIL